MLEILLAQSSQLAVQLINRLGDLLHGKKFNYYFSESYEISARRLARLRVRDRLKMSGAVRGYREVRDGGFSHVGVLDGRGCRKLGLRSVLLWLSVCTLLSPTLAASLAGVEHPGVCPNKLNANLWVDAQSTCERECNADQVSLHFQLSPPRICALLCVIFPLLALRS